MAKPARNSGPQPTALVRIGSPPDPENRRPGSADTLRDAHAIWGAINRGIDRARRRAAAPDPSDNDTPEAGGKDLAGEPETDGSHREGVIGCPTPDAGRRVQDGLSPHGSGGSTPSVATPPAHPEAGVEGEARVCPTCGSTDWGVGFFVRRDPAKSGPCPDYVHPEGAAPMTEQSLTEARERVEPYYEDEWATIYHGDSPDRQTQAPTQTGGLARVRTP